MQHTARTPKSEAKSEAKSDPAADARRQALLLALGAAVRARRTAQELTIRALAQRARVSARFLVQLEGGTGNISVARLADVAEALDTTAADLLRDAEQRHSSRHAATTSDGPGVIALLGLRGAGKSTLGARVAERLGVPFVELDRLIAQEAGMSLATIWEMHGEAYFRRAEHAALRRFLDRVPSAVLATGGSLVMHADSYELLRARARTVWLKASPQDHWERVVAQGDGRPMKDRPAAMTELRNLLRERRPLYALASHVIDTSSMSLEEATKRIVEHATS